MEEGQDKGFYDIVDITIRPVRVLWCVSQSRMDYISIVLHFNTRLWGGKFNAIVPIIKNKIPDFWVHFVKNYDPDMIVFVTDEQLLSSKENFSELLYFKKLSVNNFQALREVKKTQTYGIGMNVHKVIDYDYPSGGYPVVLEFPDENELLVYRLASIGHSDPYEDCSTYEDQNWETYYLCDYYRSLDFLNSDSGFAEKITWICNDFLRSINPETNRKKKITEVFSLDWLNQLSLSSERTLDLEFDLSLKFRDSSAFKNNILVIVGSYNDIENLSLFWNLRMSKKNVLWIPSDFLKTTMTRLNLSKEFKFVFLLSPKTKFEELVGIADNLNSLLPDQKVEAYDLSSSDLIPIAKAYSKEVGVKSSPLFISDNRAVIFNEKINDFIKNILFERGKTNLIVELKFKMVKIPPRKFLSTLISSSGRITVDKGYCFLITDDIEINLPYPFNFNFKVQIPDLSVILETWFKYSFGDEFNDYKLSDKGKYSKKAIELFGSLEECVLSFKEENRKRLIQSFFKIKQEVNGRNIVKYDHTYSSVKKEIEESSDQIVFDEEILEQILEQLIEKKIILQGLRLKCKECDNEEWYPLSKITESFQCTRCLSLNHVFFKPTWYFRLNECIFQAYNHNFQSTIKGILYLKEKSQNTFEYLPEIKISYIENSIIKESEFDFVGVLDGKLFIGEGKKTYGGFKENAYLKLISLTKKLRPDIVVLSFYRLDGKRSKWIGVLEANLKDLGVEFHIVE